MLSATDERRSFPKGTDVPSYWHPHPEWLRGPPSILSDVHQRLCPESKRGQGNIVTADHRTVAPKLQTVCSYTSCTLNIFVAW
jgi:hypothetical protein